MIVSLTLAGGAECRKRMQRLSPKAIVSRGDPWSHAPRFVLIYTRSVRILPFDHGSEFWT